MMAPPPWASSTGEKAQHIISVPQKLTSISRRAAERSGDPMSCAGKHTPALLTSKVTSPHMSATLATPSAPVTSRV